MVFVKLVLLVYVLLYCLLIIFLQFITFQFLVEFAIQSMPNISKNISEIHKASGKNDHWAMLHLDFLHHHLLVKTSIHRALVSVYYIFFLFDFPSFSMSFQKLKNMSFKTILWTESIKIKNNNFTEEKQHPAGPLEMILNLAATMKI